MMNQESDMNIFFLTGFKKQVCKRPKGLFALRLKRIEKSNPKTLFE